MAAESLLDVGVTTDIGRKRPPPNQDTYGFTPNHRSDLKPRTGYIALVADGVGGGARGAEASALAKDAFINAYFAGEAGTVPERLQSAAVHANSAVYNRAQAFGGETMATTLVAAAILPTGETHIVNVGDSRAYLYRNGQVQQLTRDHNVAALAEGGLDEASHAHAQNRLTRCIGAEPTTIADAFQLQLAPGEHLLLCSDGLTKHLTGDAELEQHLRRPNAAQATVEALVKLANERGGSDNITVMLVKFGADRARLPGLGGDDLPTVIPRRRNRRNNITAQLREWLPIILGVAILALVVGTLFGLSQAGSKYNPFAKSTPTPAVTELPKIGPTKTPAATATETETPTVAAAVAAPTEPLPTTVPPSPAATSASTVEPAATTPISATVTAAGTPVAARTPGTCNWTVKPGNLIDEIAKAILRAEGYATPQGEQVRDKRDEIAKQNDLPNPDDLKLEQVLKLTWPDSTKIISGNCPLN